MNLTKDLVAASATPIILGVLTAGEDYGYSILRRITEASAGRIEWSEGMLYPLLHRLEHQGLITARWGEATLGRRRKYYSITPQGTAELTGRPFNGARRCRHPGRALSTPHPTDGGGMMIGPPPPAAEGLDAPLGEWRDMMTRRPGITTEDVDELEDHLLSEVHDLRRVGLSPEEAFIAVRRLGSPSDAAREYGAVHTDRLWRQLVLTPSEPSPAGKPSLRLGFACRARPWAPRRAGDAHPLLVHGRRDCDRLLPAQPRVPRPALPDRLPAARAQTRSRSGLTLLLTVFAASALLVNLYPFTWPHQTLWLTTLHLPIALASTAGIAYLGKRWRSPESWMDWVRFLGEAVIYYVLIVLVGALISMLIMQIFIAVDAPATSTVFGWVFPVCAAGAVLVCAWLVERKKSVMDNMAPVLTAVFTLSFTLGLLSFLVVVLTGGRLISLIREVLISFNGLLIVVVMLCLHETARRPESSHRGLDWMQPHGVSLSPWTCCCCGRCRASPRIRDEPQQAGSPGVQRDPAGPPGGFSVALREGLGVAETRVEPGALAMLGVAGVRRLGGHRGVGLPTPVRLPVSPCSPVAAQRMLASR